MTGRGPDEVVAHQHDAAVLAPSSRDWHDKQTLFLVALFLVAVAFVIRGFHARQHEVIAVGVAGLFIVRGLSRGRPMATRHAALFALLVVAAYVVDERGHHLTALAATLAAGPALVLPRRPPRPMSMAERRHMWQLVDGTRGDTIAPFAMRTDKSHVLSPDGRAGVAYRVRFGTAVAAGDPVGDTASHVDAVAAFYELAQAAGWRVAVLASHEDQLHLWRRKGVFVMPIGRDVVIGVEDFALDGRRFRNLRQAVQRTHNSGVTTEIIAERELDPAVRAELAGIVDRVGRSGPTRGFAMILDGLLEGVHPGTVIALARDATGEVVAFQRYATSDAGRELSLDLPFRAPGAPNGVDERLVVDVVDWAKDRGVRRMSLAFAPFPELFAETERGVLQRMAYWSVHRLDPLIRVESLYRFLRKFHAFGGRRFIVLRPLDVVWAAAAMLSLEFSPRRRSG